MKLMGIYYLYNSATEKYYVGSSNHVRRRIGVHLRQLRNGKHGNIHLQRAWDQSGEAAFSTGLAEEVTDESVLIEREQEWIDLFGGYNIAKVAGRTTGVSMSEAGRSRMRQRMLSDLNPTKGTKRPEVGEMFRLLHTGKKLTAEHRAKCSAALVGENNPRYGHKMSDETKAKIGAANRGRVFTPEHRAKLSKAGKGRPHSAEHVEKLRVASTGRKHSEETKLKISSARLGKKLNVSEAERQARRERMKNCMTPEARAKAIAKRTGTSNKPK